MSDRNYWTALRQRKISRRTMLGASAKAGVGAAGLALVGCGDDDEPDAGAVAAERAATAAEEAAAAAIAAGEARAAETEAAADAAAEAAAAASEASAAASQAADAADAAAALAAEAAESEDAANAAAAAEAAAAAAADAAAAASAAGDQAAAAVAAAASEAAEAAAQAARDAAAAVEAGTATAAAAQAAIDEAAAAAAAAAEAAGEASAAAGEAAATAQQTADAAAETAAAAVAAAQEAADAAQEAAESAAMAAEEDEAPATGPRHGGVLTYSGDDGGILDPAIADHGGLDSSWLPIYDHINYLDNGGVLTSAMAELPEVVDDVTFIYTIKPNVHWQDRPPLNGRQFVAEDAAFGLARFGQDNPEFVLRDLLSAVDQYEVTDDLTLRLKAKEVFAPLLGAVGEQRVLMISRDAVEAFGDDGIASNPEAGIGTGGMQYANREDGVVTELERNPNYFREGLPYFDGLRSNHNLDGAYRAAQYVAGESDFVFLPWLGFPSENEGVIAQLGEENVVEVPMQATWSNSTHFHTKVEPYTDPRVRLALHLATNREQLFAVAQGFVEIGGPIAHASGAYAWSVDELRQRPGYRSGAQREEDLAEGRRLLDASGYDPASVPPMSSWDGTIHFAQVFQQNVAEIGFEVDLEEFANMEGQDKRTSGNFSIHWHGLGGAHDPDILNSDVRSDGGRNYGEFADPEIDALLEQGRTTLGAEDRVAIYDEIQTKLLEEHVPRIFWCWGRPVAGHRPWLKGYGPTNHSTAATQRLYRSWFEGKPGV